jgi:WD40 repeat protein
VDVDVDGAGNIYVAGTSIRSAGTEDFHVQKLNSSGVEVWNNRYNSATGNSQNMRCISLDPQANVYVTGSSQGPTGRDYQTMMWDSAGNQQWVLRYNGTGGPQDEPWGLDVNALGMVAVTGSSVGVTSSTDYATVMYYDSSLTALIEKSTPLAGINCFPNPASSSATVSYMLTEAAAVSLKVTDISGRLVMYRSCGMQTRGTHELDLNVSELRNGIYFCALQAGEQSSVIKISVNK